MPDETKRSPFWFFRHCETFFPKLFLMSPKGPPSIFWYFATEWMLKKPKGSLFFRFSAPWDSSKFSFLSDFRFFQYITTNNFWEIRILCVSMFRFLPKLKKARYFRIFDIISQGSCVLPRKRLRLESYQFWCFVSFQSRRKSTLPELLILYSNWYFWWKKALLEKNFERESLTLWGTFAFCEP